MTDIEMSVKFINQEKRFFTKELRELENTVPRDAHDDYVHGTSAARCGCRNAIAACNTILSALRAQQERENPKSLTLGELREMDGEPAWCDWINGWAIVHIDDKIRLEFTYYDGSQNTYSEFVHLGITPLAYRYKPKKAQS